jgi:hypothetical protein
MEVLPLADGQRSVGRITFLLGTLTLVSTLPGSATNGTNHVGPFYLLAVRRAVTACFVVTWQIKGKRLQKN